MPASRARRPGRSRDIGRKQRGDFPTPPELVERVLDGVLPAPTPGAVVRVVDPACGDGRFLAAAADRLLAAGMIPELHGVDVAAAATAAARRSLRRFGDSGVSVRLDTADALTHRWPVAGYDLVVGNPPYLSQLATATSRGGSSSRGGGPYADAAAEFLALAVDLARPGGRIGLVLPQSILSSRDAGGIRREVDRRARRTWSWWSPERWFEAQVTVCALGFERRADPSPGGDHDEAEAPAWTDVICEALGVPPLPEIDQRGTAGDVARFSADFRDCYYGLVPATRDRGPGAALVTSGLIDPGRSRWGERPVRFAGRVWAAPRVDVEALSPPMRAWADAMRRPKVLIANQSRVLECVVDPDGTTLAGVPVITARPDGEHADAAASAWELAAVLTSPYASTWAWHAAAGTGLSATAIRVGPRLLAKLPWPAGSLAGAVEALRAGDLAACGRAVDRAFGAVGTAADEHRHRWWTSSLPTSSPKPTR